MVEGIIKEFQKNQKYILEPEIVVIKKNQLFLAKNKIVEYNKR